MHTSSIWAREVFRGSRCDNGGQRPGLGCRPNMGTRELYGRVILTLDAVHET
jgi:hypothetical protein